MDKLKILQKIAEERGGKCLSTSFGNTYKTKYKFNCNKCNCIWESTYKNITKKTKPTWCPNCGGTGKKDLKYLYKLANKFEGKCMSNIYINSKTKYKWKCKEGHIFEMRANDVDQGHWCKKCNVGRDITINAQNILEMAKQIGYCFIEGKLLTKQSKITWKCDVGHLWKTSYASLENGHKCIICQGKAKHDVEWLQELASKKEGQCLSTEYKNSRTKYQWRCKNGHVFFMQASDVHRNHWCPRCCFKITKGHQEIIDFIKELGFREDEILINTRSIISPKELDVFIPKAKLAIEYNGLYWHSEANPNYNKYQHIEKFKLCKQNGIKLLAIYEDEWEFKKDLIKSMIKWRLGLFDGIKLNASKLTLKRADKNKEFKEFFEKYHLDGHAKSKFAYGLFLNDKLIICASVRKNFNGEYEIARLATDFNYSVRGGASKLIKAIKSEIGDNNLISFSNNRLSNGDVYIKNNFSLSKEIGPSYWYTDGNIRLWRFKCKRINKLEILNKYPTEKLQAKAGVFSEIYLGHNLSMYQIHDYGHKKWILE